MSLFLYMSIFSLFTQKKSQPDKPLSLGQWGELAAAKVYEEKGYSIVSRNEFNRRGLRLGEIDFIAHTKIDIAFVEVKTRTQEHDLFGTGFEAVNHAKQQKLLKAVHSFRNRDPKYNLLRPHIDVCVVIVPMLDRLNFSVKIIENSVEDWN